ncbi:potassium-transporting ATPase subunit KdpC [Cellulomonas sp. Leaf334]|uniref:potassium-transporting ATPase subunit KdpC n=1 Tax=Cellulomonas sp. Leaf334 TaxID=1736339 RepID=UPI0009E89E66|nr:potassium-transporting ATPase subunit KdpC [Cellulomonas sp. Leaf334]
MTTTRPHHSAGSDTVAFARQTWAGLRVLLVLTLLLGFAYPLAVTGVAQVAFPWQANGSLVSSAGERVTSRDDAVGSLLVGQAFDGPQWFHPRPSAAGEGYDTLASAGSNLGPLHQDLLAAVEERRSAVADADGVDRADVPVDALTASASGLDPDISPEYAQLQVARVARERGLAQDEVRALVDDTTVGRDLGVLGEPRVNVLRLNLALHTMGS